VRQLEGRRHRDLSQRARHQPHLPGPRHPLRHGDPCRRDRGSRATRPRSR
jgi:hypothetical protein